MKLPLRRRHWLGVGVGAAAVLAAGAACAQNVTIDFGNGSTLTERAVQLVALITILSLAPSILVMVTSFTRIVVVLSLLRSAIGLQSAPPNAVMISLALFLTAFVMMPTFQTAYDQGVRPLVDQTIEAPEALQRVSVPFHDFMMKHVREKDLALFVDLSGTAAP
jgi:flagellar biosynthetic protein FliP